MFQISERTKIYVAANACYKTGGLELLHQLVFELNRLGHDATIVYFNTKREGNINPEFKKYVSTYITREGVEDDEDNVLIVPETRVQLLQGFRRIQKCVWWLSVDNYFPTTSFGRHAAKHGVLRTLKHMIFYHDVYREWELRSVAGTHLSQSQYAIDFLHERGVGDVIYLSDYINDIYLMGDGAAPEREDVVAYNPAKGREFTQKIIGRCGNLRWVALEGMSNEEIRAALRGAKLYIDFGGHPGKDRIPREAAVSGCCVITSRSGSAANAVDVPIPEEFKFDAEEGNLDSICRTMRRCLDDFGEETRKFEPYRDIIRGEKEAFSSSVERIFRVAKNG